VITAYRIVKSRYADDAFSGVAARRNGGRWNPVGTAVVYTSWSMSLATLETLVHIESELLYDFVGITCSFHEALVERVDRRRLPQDWAGLPPPIELAAIGYEWVTSRASAVLEVPSAVIPEEVNYLINPEHEDFRSIDIGLVRPINLDLRLLNN
jgi:RES domain-containing protein